jgi:hypothetical protein
MHVLQWIAIEVDETDTKEDALLSVQGNLEDMLNPDYQNGWFDWFVAGGGRWNTQEGDDHIEVYKENKTNLVIHAGTELDKFKERISTSLEARKEEFDRYVEHADVSIIDKVISDYDPAKPNYEHFQKLYELKKVIDMAYGEWDFNSYFFDLHNETTNPQYALEGIDKNPNVWYLIPVDFHF